MQMNVLKEDQAKYFHNQQAKDQNEGCPRMFFWLANAINKYIL
jgi:hypothetical protein